MSSSSTRIPRILRGVESERMSTEAVSLELPDGIRGRSVTVAEQLEAARRAGYDEGWRAAKAAAATGSEAERDAQLARVADALVHAVVMMKAARLESVGVAASDAVELAFELAGAILQRELALSDSVPTDALARAVALVPTGEDVVVRLHPGDAIDPADLQMLLPDSTVRVVADPAVEAGGCVVEAGPCRVDAQIGAALARARQLIDTLTTGHGQAVPVETVAVGEEVPS
jgi:flagellar assembly protein FliH